MYERFTDRARKVMKLANAEAIAFGHDFVDTEHILLGLIKEGSGVAANVLKNLDLDLEKIRVEVERLVPRGPDRVMQGVLPRSPAAEKVAAISMEEARTLNHNYVGTEHLLLGLLRDQEGAAVQVLMNLSLKPEVVRKEVLDLLGHGIDSADEMVQSGTEHQGTSPPDPSSHDIKTGRSMYDKFTDRARKVMQLANQEAQRFNHEYIGTEHVLLGLLKEGSGVAANVLKNLDVDLRKIRLELEKIIQSGPDMVTLGKLPQTPRAKKLIEYSMEEARNLNHNYVGTEHILLGLLREDEGVAAQVLMNLGLKLVEVREEVLAVLGAEVQNTKWIERGAGPAREKDAEGTPRQPTSRLHGLIQAARRRKAGRARYQSWFEAKDVVLGLAWFFLALGVVGLALGVAGESNLALPGAILIGASLIALAVGWR